MPAVLHFPDRPHGGDIAAVDQNHPVCDQRRAVMFKPLNPTCSRVRFVLISCNLV
jgi:hypothetical protein